MQASFSSGYHEESVDVGQPFGYDGHQPVLPAACICGFPRQKFMPCRLRNFSTILPAEVCSVSPIDGIEIDG